MNTPTLLRVITFCTFCALSAACAMGASAAPRWVAQPSGTTERLRAVSAVDAEVAWASGNRGTVLRTTDGGETWQSVHIPGADELDFRDIEAFDAETAYLLSVGTGTASRIYKTEDGGAHWTMQFINQEPTGFYDAIAFWDAARGLAFGDPVDGRYTVMRTEDGGRTWRPVPPEAMPPALPGESAFAASGGCLTVQGENHAWFATGGGARARVFRSRDAGLTWQVADTPLIAGRDSAGAFALAFFDSTLGIVVGGDHRREAELNSNLARTRDGGARWEPIGAAPPAGLRSSVAFLPGSTGRGIIIVGPRGSEWSTDGGHTWMALGGTGLHALAVAGIGRATTIWAVGEAGQIVKLLPLPMPAAP